MAYMVARTEKRKIGSLGGYQNHVDRKTGNHSNKDIDDSKTHLNYDLIGHEKSTSFHEEFMDYIKENRVGSRAVRKDAVIMQDWLISSSQEFFDTLNENETKRYFETAVEFFAEKFGRENIRFATVHMDEKTPHMHMGIVPLRDGKLTAKTIFDRNCLRMIQNELPQAFQKAGFDIQRGEPKSEKIHLHPEEYKATMRAAQEKSKEIIKEAELRAEMEHIKLDTQSYDLWEKDWDKTKKDFPDFEFVEHVEAVTEITDELNLFEEHNLRPNPRDYPRANNISFEKVFALLQEKFNQVREYIALQAHKMASKASEMKNGIEVLGNTEKSLERRISQKRNELSNIDEILAKQSAIKEVSDDIQRHLYSLAGVSQEENDIKIKKGILGEKTVTMPYSKFEALKLATYDGAFRKGKEQFEQKIENTLSCYKRWLSESENKVEEYKELYKDEMQEKNNYIKLYKEKLKLVKSYEEIANNIPDEAWDTAIEKIEMRIEQEREMPSIDFEADYDRGMNGPSL